MSDDQTLQEVDEVIGEPVIVFGELSSEPMRAFVAALATAQGEFETIVKNRTARIQPRDPSKSPYTFDYADLEEIRNKTQPALSRNGLAITSLPVFQAQQGRQLRTLLLHKDGGYMQADLPIPTLGDGNITEVIKQFGGLMTYLRRYAQIAMLNVAADNDVDDGGGDDMGNGNMDGGPAVHPAMKAAKSASELAKIMGGLSKADKARYADYFNVRQRELKEAAGEPS
jgi:hypothetical protein